jgi:hypothetical protein
VALGPGLFNALSTSWPLAGVSCAWILGRSELADDAAAKADGDGMGARTRLQLREQMPDVRLDRLLRQEEPLADLTVHEALRDQLQHLDLPHGGLLLQFPKRALERNHLAAGSRAPASGNLLEATRMIRVAGHDFLALSGVHAEGIGGTRYPL